MSDQQHEPLTLLRLAITTHTPPILSTSPQLPPSSAPQIPLNQATYLIFRNPTTVPFPLTTPTRFHKKEGENPGPVDLRSIYFAWVNRDLAIPDYVALAQGWQGGEGGGIRGLVFVERLELVGWLEGVQEESEFIMPEPKKALSGGAAGGAGGVGGMIGGGAAGAGGPRQPRQVDPRLLEIYGHERVVVNRNTALRGTKPMDFGYVRKHTEDFVSRLKTTGSTKPGMPTGTPNSRGEYASSSIPGTITPHKSNSSLSGPQAPSVSSGSSSRSYPIILLSPSASALLNMANIKPFLESGTFLPPIPTTTSSGSASTAPSLSTAPQMLDISRLLPSISATTPQRFIVVDSPEKFKPEYWARVVAVFTTGQTWQFRSYKWHNPADLFRHVKGFYVGWEGEGVPESVRSWGGAVTCVGVDRSRRFRDREVCEVVWMEIERWM
ncbi:RNA pol II accessory factor, Cdc73 family-domain-containing protein, partial [Peziza echinospora]